GPFRSARSNADLFATRRCGDDGAARRPWLAVAAGYADLGAARLARLLGRARPLVLDPGASLRTGAGGGALHLSRSDLDVGARLPRLRRHPEPVDAYRRRRGDPVRTLSLRPRAQGAWTRGRPCGLRHRH